MGLKKTKGLILERIKEAYGLKNNAELARFLGVKPNTISNWYSRNTIDYDIIFSKCEDTDLDWLINGIVRNKTKSELMPLSELNDMERESLVEFTQDEDSMRNIIRSVGFSRFLTKLLSQTGYESTDSEYTHISMNIESINDWVKHYSTLYKFMKPYDDFIENRITYQELLSGFKSACKVEKKLLNILSQYKEILDNIYDEISEFNNKYDRFMSLDDIVPSDFFEKNE